MELTMGSGKAADELHRGVEDLRGLVVESCHMETAGQVAELGIRGADSLLQDRYGGRVDDMVLLGAEDQQRLRDLVEVSDYVCP